MIANKELTVFKYIDWEYKYIIVSYYTEGELLSLIEDYKNPNNVELHSDYEDILEYLGDLELVEYFAECDDIECIYREN